MRGTLFDIKPLHRAIESIFSRPLQEAARETLGRELRTGIASEKLADLVLRSTKKTAFASTRMTPKSANRASFARSV
jgi:hypothetical protein